MPSELRVLDDSETVQCRMVNGTLPAAVCAEEQGVRECTGCTASSRRCTACGRVRGIADAEHGWCESCVQKKGGLVTRADPPEGTQDEQLKTIFDRVREIGSAAARLPIETQTFNSREREEVGSSPLLKDVARLYAALMEHGVERNGAWSVHAPIQILMSRFHLLREEAVRVLNALAEQLFLEGSLPWSEAILLKTDGIKELKEETERYGHRLQAPSMSADINKARSQTAAARRTPSRSAALSDASSLIANLPSMRPVATYGEIYADLFKRSYDVKGERVIGGARPSLQIRFKLSEQQAVETLEWFEANGHVRRKDEWRTIILVSDKVESSEGPARNAKQGGKPVMPPRPQPAAATRTPSVSTTSVPKPPRPPSSPSGLAQGASDQTLTQIERALPKLRKQRDSIDQTIAKLEAVAVEMKRLEASAKQLLATIDVRDDE